MVYDDEVIVKKPVLERLLDVGRAQHASLVESARHAEQMARRLHEAVGNNDELLSLVTVAAESLPAAQLELIEVSSCPTLLLLALLCLS